MLMTIGVRKQEKNCTAVDMSWRHHFAKRQVDRFEGHVTGSRKYQDFVIIMKDYVSLSQDNGVRIEEEKMNLRGI